MTPSSSDSQPPPPHQPRPHGPWKIVRSEEKHRDPWTRVVMDEVIRPDGHPGTYTVIHLKPGVCVVAVDQDEVVHLTEEFHYAVGRVTVEGVSGGCEPGEDPLDTARRELLEELGITASRWESLGVIDPFTANVYSPTCLFAAYELTFVEPQREGSEIIRHVKLRLDEAIERVFVNQITHGPTCTVLLKLSHLHRKG